MGKLTTILQQDQPEPQTESVPAFPATPFPCDVLADSFDFGAVEQKRHLSMLEVRSRSRSGDVRPGLVTTDDGKSKTVAASQFLLHDLIRMRAFHLLRILAH